MEKESACRISTEKGVLASETIRNMGRGSQVVVTEFEDLMLFKSPVRLAELHGELAAFLRRILSLQEL